MEVTKGKADWRSVSTEPGEQFVEMYLTKLRQQWPVASWASQDKVQSYMMSRYAQVFTNV